MENDEIVLILLSISIFDSIYLVFFIDREVFWETFSGTYSIP